MVKFRRRVQSSILSSATKRSDEPRAEAGESRRQRSRLQAARLGWTWPLKQNKQCREQPSRAALYERAVREAVLAGTHPSGQRPLCVFLVEKAWFYSWVPDTVLDAWYATTLDTEDILSGANERQTHIYVADVIASFDTVDRGILGCASGRLGFPSWFRRVYFSYHARVKLRFKLACLDPLALVSKRRPPGKNSAQSSVDLGAAAANVTEAPEAEAWFLGYAAMQEAAVWRGASHNRGTMPCLPMMCLGPLGTGRPTARSPRRGCSHWALHQSATGCNEPCRCQCPSTDCTFCRRHCVYLAGGARQDGLREYKLGLTWTKRCLTTLGLFLPQEQRAASEGALRGRTWPGRKWLRVKHSWDRVVEHGRDLRCCIAPRRFRSDGCHASLVASCLRFRRFRQPRLKKAVEPRAREAPAAVRFPSFLAWRKRWCRMLSVSCSRAFCGSLFLTAEDLLVGTDGAAPALADLLPQF